MQKDKVIFDENSIVEESHHETNSLESIPSSIRNQPKSSLYNNKFIQFLQKFSQWIDSLGVESGGIDRVPPYQRGTHLNQFIQVLGYWISATGGLSSMSAFLLGPLLFELTFKQSLLCGLTSMSIGCLVAAYCSIMGPQSGCRQMVTARYLFGWWFVKFVALAAILGVLGWSIVNAVVGGEMLAAISNDKVPISVGIIIVTICSFFVAVFGIKQVLKVETIFSVPVIITFMLLYIASSDKNKYLNDFNNRIGENKLDSLTLKGNWLSFFSLCYSTTSTWGSIASDYYILFPEDTSKFEVFMLTLCGTLLPTLFVGVLGVMLSSIAMSYEPWFDEYTSHGMGGLLWSGFQRWNGFGKFCVVILILSLVSNNIINTYSASFSIQLSSIWAKRIPRWVWTIACTVVYFICAIVGRNHFSTILGNFLPMIGYWLTMYFILLLEENEIFRRFHLHLYTKEFPIKVESDEEEDEDGIKNLKSRQSKNIHSLKRKYHMQKHNYNWEKWDDYDILTHGYAATFSFLCGIAGVVIGMAQAYWIGPVAAKIGKYGGDIAMWLCMSISGIVFPPLRYLELKKYGR